MRQVNLVELVKQATKAVKPALKDAQDKLKKAEEDRQSIAAWTDQALEDLNRDTAKTLAEIEKEVDPNKKAFLVEDVENWLPYRLRLIKAANNSEKNDALEAKIEKGIEIAVQVVIVVAKTLASGH